MGGGLGEGFGFGFGTCGLAGCLQAVGAFTPDMPRASGRETGSQYRIGPVSKAAQ